MKRTSGSSPPLGWITTSLSALRTFGRGVMKAGDLTCGEGTFGFSIRCDVFAVFIESQVAFSDSDRSANRAKGVPSERQWVVGLSKLQK
jgi:hypothetical protein